MIKGPRFYYGNDRQKEIFNPTENFDPVTSKVTQKKTFRKFWKNGILFRSRSTEDWVQAMKFDNNLRAFIIPRCIERFVFEKAITREEADGYLAMIKSNDEESWALAMAILKTFKPKKRK